MTKTEVIERLCRLVTRVGDVVYSDAVPHDCFCRPDFPRPTVSEDVIRFIEDAVNARIAQGEK